MKIAVWYNLGGGGAKRALHQHVQGLVDAGHDVHVWCPSTARRDFLPLAELCPEHVDPVDATAFRGASGRRGTVTVGVDPRRGLRELARHWDRVAAQVTGGGFDVLFANTCQYNAVPALAQRTGIPALLYLQEPRRTSYEALPVLPWVGLPGFAAGRAAPARAVRELVTLRSARALARAEIAAAWTYDRVLVNSVFSRESVVRAYGIDPLVCYLGVDTEAFTPSAQPPAGHLLGVGQVVPHKRLDLVVEALAQLPAPRPRLVWVGDRSDPAYAADLLARAAAAGVDLEIRVSAPDAELVDLMRSASAVVHAARLEPFGYTPVEAAACGVPAVVVAEGGMKETVVAGQTGWVAEPDARSLAAALSECLQDPPEGRRRGARGRELAVRDWTVTAAAQRLERHLVEVAAGPGRETRP